MIRLISILVLAALLPIAAAAAPVVSNVTASQRDDDSMLVDITYDLSGGTSFMEVTVLVSQDNGANFNVAPSSHLLSGDVGQGMINGTGYHIVWDAGQDVPEIYWPQTRVRVTATETDYLPDEFTVYLPGDVPMELVRIPAGTFVMGSQFVQNPRTVTISRDFLMGKYAVTQQQWLAVRGEWPGPLTPAPKASGGVGLGDDLPAYLVSWNDTQDFLADLSDYLEATGQIPHTVRLPTEAEWEYAGRAGTTTLYYFGNATHPEGDNDCGLTEERDAHVWYCGNTGEEFTEEYGVKPVGTKLPNPWGLYDIHGNVFEWCSDFYATLDPGEYTDPTGPETGSNRIGRGGSWSMQFWIALMGTRLHADPTVRHASGGFRVVMAP